MKPPESCFPQAHNGLTSSHCCYTTNSSFAGALARNTNASGQLFLDESGEEACAQEAQNISLTTPYCDIAPPAFTANQGPCLFANRSQLEDILNDVNSSVPLTTLSAKCANVQQEEGCMDCQSFYYEARQILVSNQEGNDSADINCGIALLVALTSLNISHPDWQYSLYSCLEIFFAPAIGMYNSYHIPTSTWSSMLR